MNPLAELHERLAYSATAGTALLEEDFRLKKMMDAFAPLAQKNPVFGKIHKGLADLFGAAPEERGKRLLNLLGLVDAVLYTQAGYGMEGELAALPEHAEPGEFQQIRYSELSGIIQALTTTGSGRIEVLKSAIANHPEYFRDSRVLHALISDLADPYGDMAVLVFRVLQALATGQPLDTYVLSGETDQESFDRLPRIDKQRLVGQLKRGFDPEGKTEMLRRLMLISTICGAEENDWYLSILDSTKKEIRAFTVFALGYTEENIPLLLKLAQKERGKAKEMAYRALCQWDTPEVVAFIEGTLDKTPKLAVCLDQTALDIYGDMAAKHLQAAFSKLLEEPRIEPDILCGQMDSIAPWIEALRNKASAGVIAFYEWTAEQCEKIPQFRSVLTSAKVQSYPVFQRFSEKICETLVRYCPPSLVDFLEKSDIWGKNCFFADLFTKSASEVYDKWSTHQEDTLYYWMHDIGYDRLGRRAIDPETGKLFVTYMADASPVLPLEGYQVWKRPIKEPLDLRWLDVFIKNDWEQLFLRVGIEGLPEAWRQKVGAYFYQKTLKSAKNRYFSVTEFQIRLYRMQQYGWKNYEDLLLNLCKSHYNIAEYQLREAFTGYREIAGEEATQKEAAKVLEFYRTTSKNPKAADAILQLLRDNGFLKGS